MRRKKKVRLSENQNRFRIAACILFPGENLFEMTFTDNKDFLEDPRVKKVIARYKGSPFLSMLVRTHTWRAEEGKVTKTFYQVMLEWEDGRKHGPFGLLDKDVKEIPRWKSKEQKSFYQFISENH